MKRSLTVATLAVYACTLWAQTPEPPRLGTESGFGIFQQKCMTCHGNANAPEKAPDRSTLRQLSPERILDALTSGAMKIQGQRLSDEEKCRGGRCQNHAQPVREQSSDGGSLRWTCLERMGRGGWRQHAVSECQSGRHHARSRHEIEAQVGLRFS